MHQQKGKRIRSREVGTSWESNVRTSDIKQYQALAN